MGVKNYLLKYPMVSDIIHSKFIFNIVSYWRKLYMNMYPYKLLDSHVSFGLLKVLFLIAVPFVCPLYIVYAYIRVFFLKKMDAKRVFPYRWAIVCIIQNEASYLREWIEYNKLIGADHILIYDNESTDNLYEVIAPYIKTGYVECIYYPGKYKQCEVYTDSVRRLRELTRYVAFIDPDEFILSRDKGVLFFDFVDKMIKTHYCGGMSLDWVIFGSSGHLTRPEGLVIENYTNRACDEYLDTIKTIANPRFVKCFVNPHYPIYKYGLNNVNENGKQVIASRDFHKSVKKICLNHYFTKSLEESMIKKSKDLVVVGLPRPDSIFKERDRNEIHDETICRYLPDLKKQIAELENIKLYDI